MALLAASQGLQVSGAGIPDGFPVCFTRRPSLAVEKDGDSDGSEPVQYLGMSALLVGF